MLGFYCGNQKGRKSRNQIRLLLRNYGFYYAITASTTQLLRNYVFNARCELMKDNDSKEVRSSGHFLLAVEQPQP